MAARAGHLSAVAASKTLFDQVVTLRSAAQEWADWLHATGRSQRTVHQYRFILWPWLKTVQDRTPSSVAESDLSGWINRLDCQDKLATRAAKLAAARSLFDFCAAKGWSVGNPAKLVRVNMALMRHSQKEPKERTPFTREEIHKLVEGCRDPFWRAAIRIGQMTGLRLGDIAQLEWASVAKPGFVICWTDKRNRRVEVPVATDRMAAVLDEISKTDPTHLFPGARHIILDNDRRSYLSIQFGRLCRRAGIAGKSFHCLRYTYAHAQAEAGKPLWYIARRMGHSNTHMTSHYTQSNHDNQE
jgi:integrase